MNSFGVAGLAVVVIASAVSLDRVADSPVPPRAPTELAFPSGLALAPDGRVLLADRGAHVVLSLDPRTGDLERIAGTGTPGFTGDNGLATEAELRNPEWVDFDATGNLLIADRGNGRVRRISLSSGVIETIAGTGRGQADGDDGPAVEASLTSPFGLLGAPGGDVYVFDTEAHSIRRIDGSSGVITTVIGTGEQGFSGDGGPGTEAALYRPHNGTWDAEGRLVFGDSFNQRIRRWDPRTGLIETIAGTGVEGTSPPGTPARSAAFTYFGAMLYEPDGSLVYTGIEGRIMRIRAADDRLELIAGVGVPGLSGDGGPATEARMAVPYGIVRLPDGDLVFADGRNARIRRIDSESGLITTIAGR